MPDEPLTITAEEIAALLHMTPDWFMRIRRRLIRDGMPRPVPGTVNRWSRRNVLRWIEGELAPERESA